MGSDNAESEGNQQDGEAAASATKPDENTSSSSRQSKKRPRSPENSESATTAAVSAASAAAAAQLAASMGWNGLYSLLSASAITSGSNSLPSLGQVQQAASKSVQECPPFVHLSKTDSAPQLKIMDDHRLAVKGGMRGYRMTRATHGISSGNYYYEVIIKDPPPISEVVAALPANARMGKKLQDQMQQALQEEKEGKERKSVFGGHVRLGWSMRTGDLQAPVGYDKWSFGVRDIGGSKIHCSKREDTWGGESFGPGDVVGCAICISAKDEANGEAGGGEIRFFKNGLPMGQFVISKGKREGGVAFKVPDGVYYPAISLYMGANVKFNPGPHFVYPPRKLPTGLKLQPVSDLCQQPISLDDAATKVQKEKTFRKPDMLQKFQDLVKSEVETLQDAYNSYRTKHVQEVKEEREKRNVKVDDLETDEFLGKVKMDEN